MIFYTNKRQEILIDSKYRLEIKKKQKEIDDKEKQTGKLHKYIASFYISKPNRIFSCKDGIKYIKIGRKKFKCPLEEIESGSIYKIDPEFTNNFTDFVSKYNNYSIEFYPNGKYGKSIAYFTGLTNVYSSILYELNNSNNFIWLEDEEKYDIACC